MLNSHEKQYKKSGYAYMFTGKFHRVNSIKPELFKCDEVMIDFYGSNTHLFNCVSAVIESGEAFVISGCGKSYTLKKFFSAGEKYDFSFSCRTLFISCHFNLFCGEGMEYLSNVPVFIEKK